MTFKGCVSILVLVCVAALVAGCAQTTATTEEITIGVVASMTGPASTTGKDIWQSAVLAQDEINAKGGVYIKELGKSAKIRVVQGDDESTREGGMKAVSKLITQDNVDLLVGGFSSAVVSAHQQTVADARVPYIISGASSTSVSRRTDIDTSYMFFHRPTTDDSAYVTTKFIASVVRPAVNAKFDYPESRPFRLAVIYQDSPYGKGQVQMAKDTIANENLSVQIVAEESFKMGETDFRTILTSVKAKNPDAVYATDFLNEHIPLVQQARRDVGLNTIFLAIEPNDDPNFYTGVGTYGEYSVLESRFSPYAIPNGPTAAATAEFVKNFDAKWKGFPGMMGVATYEAVYIAAEAIEKAGSTDKAKVRDALAATDMPQMIETMQNGTISFSPDFRESKFELFVEQLRWDDAAKEPRPKIVWPDTLKETDFVLPDWYAPGSG